MSTLYGRSHQWTLANGVEQIHTDLLVARTFASHPSARHHQQVFVAVQAVGDAQREHAACALVANTLVAALRTDRSPSVTSALRRAFAAAHDALCAHNAKLPPTQRTLVGASCAVLHGTSLYIAQVQPAHVWVQHNGQMRALPPWDTTGTAHSTPALGSSLYTAPELAHTPVAPNDLLVLCSQGVAQATYADQIDALLRANNAHAVAAGLRDLCTTAQVQTAHALVITWEQRAWDRTGKGPARFPTVKRLPHGAGAPHVLAHDQPLPPAPVALPPKRRSNEERGWRTLLPNAQPRPNTTLPFRQDERRNRVRSSPIRGHAERAHARRAQATLPPRRTVPQRIPVRWLATLLLACVVAFVGVAVQQWGRRGTGVALAAIADVERAVALAENATTPVGAQQALAAAQSTFRSDLEPLVQAGTINPADADVWQPYQQVLGRYEQAMTAIDRVTFVDDLQVAATLPDKGLINRIVLGAPAQRGASPALFLLDRSGSQVWQAGQPTPLLAQGTPVAGVPVTRLRDAVWRGDKLVLFERGDRRAPAYRLVYQDGAQWTATALTRTDNMAPRDGDLPLATFGGNVYMWDRDTHQVWQYNAGQLSLPPTPVINAASGVRLNNVVDIAVDGRMYLLNSDGSIVVVNNGTVAGQWLAPQLAVPISTVTRFVVTPAWTSADGVPHPGAIYLLDTQHERVIQLDKTTGAVVQQLQARQHGTLNQLTDLAIDEAGRMIYVANGDEVRQLPLPQPASSVPFAPPEPVK